MPANEPNIAYSQEYQAYRSSYDWIFDLPHNEVKTISFGDDIPYTATCFLYKPERPHDNGIIAIFSATKVLIKSNSGTTVYEYTIIGEHGLLKFITHKNGRQYLIFSRELYGYSVMDMTSHEVAHYVPESSFKGGETFIWADVLYCEINNLLVVDGCYWACPDGNEFYDFSSPMALPLPKYCDSYALENEFNISIDDYVTTAHFTAKGECVINCLDQSGNAKKLVIDIIDWHKKLLK